MKVLRVDHLGIAVASFEKARALWEDKLGLTLTHEEVVTDQGVKTFFYPVAGLKFELLESIDPAGPIAKHIAQRGEGVQHVAFEVDDLDAAIAHFKAKGVRVLGEKPRRGVENTRIVFLHPKDTGGILMELVEFPR